MLTTGAVSLYKYGTIRLGMPVDVPSSPGLFMA